MQATQQGTIVSEDIVKQLNDYAGRIEDLEVERDEAKPLVLVKSVDTSMKVLHHRANRLMVKLQVVHEGYCFLLQTEQLCLGFIDFQNPLYNK